MVSSSAFEHNHYAYKIEPEYIPIFLLSNTMRNWAINLLINASKKNSRRRERLFKYFSDIQVENGIVRFNSTSTPTRVYDIEAQAFTYTESHTGRLVYEDLVFDEPIESQLILYEPADDLYDYEPIDGHT
jgi:hypothetical protein